MNRPTEWLDGLRGFAALIVLFGHCSGIGMNVIPFVDLTGSAKVGVWLFFVLSAYLLSKPLADDIAATGWRAVIAFYIRRVFRILPLYYAFLIASTLIENPIMFAPEVAWQHAVFIRGDQHLWTIPVEMTFYLLLPAFAVFGNRTSALALLAISAALYLVCNSGVGNNSIALPSYAIFFALGIAVAYLRPLHGMAWGLTGLALMAISLPVIQIFLGLGYRDGMSFAAIGGAAVLFGGLSSEAFRAPFAWAPLRFIGKIGFGIYLLHVSIVFMVKDAAIPDVIKGPVAFLIVVAVSAVVHFSFEKPMNRFGHWLASHLKSPA